MRTFKAPPKASMLIESMRDIGYSLETAVADIIDNSISAGASKIQLFTDIGETKAKIAIIDNGEGMSEEELRIAMRPGSRNPLDSDNTTLLGRFGLGLKTASFSQCRKLTLMTRKNGIGSAAIWDLDYVEKVDDWVVIVPEDLTSISWGDRLGKNGTLVLWEVLDRVIEPDASDHGLSHFFGRIDDVAEHLELVFHRYLAGERGKKKIRIFLNERPLEAFDPFHSNHAATIPGPVEKIKVGKNMVTLQAFTLPHHKKVSAADWEKYAGRAGYLKNQGFYVYRERRLILHGTWFGLARPMELTKLARVRIDIPSSLDAEWKIDVKKASAQPPYQVKERLRRIIETIGATSKRVYTVRGRRLITDDRLPVWNRIQDKNEIIYQINPEHPVLEDFVTYLPDDLKNKFKHIMELAGSSLPVDTLFADMGNEPEKVKGNITPHETLIYTVQTTVNKLKERGIKQEDIFEMLRVTEPFRSNWQQTEKLLEKMQFRGRLECQKTKKI